jgi:glutamate 5-kinase
MENRRVVIKFGSSSLTADDGLIDRNKLAHYVNNIIELRNKGFTPIIVSSGAVAAGYGQIGYKKRPKLLHQKQAAAAVGQALLMQVYQELFASHHVAVAQLLLTRMDLTDRTRCRNAFNTLEELLKQGVIPIINENDSVSIDELKFGDNDSLSSFVTNLVKGSYLVIVTDMNGLYTADPRKKADAVRISMVQAISDEILKSAGEAGTDVGTGGMRTKIEAARVALFGGSSVYIGKVTANSTLSDILNGVGDGTYFPHTSSPLSVKKQWLGFHSLVRGELIIDEGATKALNEEGKSLLPVGIQNITGEFHIGDVVEVKTTFGTSVGRGICNYNHWQIQAVKGMSSDEILKRVQVDKLEVIHRDDWMSYSNKGVVNHE